MSPPASSGPSRRAVLAAVGSLALAGCSTRDDSADPTPTPPAENPIDAVSGSYPQYRFDAANRGVDPSAVGPASAPSLAWLHERPAPAGPLCTLADGRLYVGDDDGTVAALDAATGAKRWTHDLGGTVRSAPAVGDGRVVVGNHRGDYEFEGDYVVTGLDPGDGSEAWRVPLADSASVGSPTLADGRAFVPTGGGGIRVVSIEDGEDGWRVPPETGAWTTPAVSGDVAYCGERAVDAATGDVVRDGPAGDAPTAVDDGVVFAGGTVVSARPVDGERTWTVEPPADYYRVGSPVVDDERVYAPLLAETSGDGTHPLLALDRTDGTERWRVETSSYVPAWAPFTVADGVVYVGGRGIRALDAATGTERWRAGESFSFGRPLVCDGVVFATTGRYVCAFA